MVDRTAQTPGKVAYINARVLDPASGHDAPGTVITDGERIVAVGNGIETPSDAQVIDCGGHCLAPGLVDIRTELCEPGQEHRGTLESAGVAATAGGITSLVCLPNTDPVIDDMSVVEFVARRARILGLTKVYAYGALTKGCKGRELAEMGMLAEAGAVAFTDGHLAIADSQVMRQALSYAATFGLTIVQHPEDPALARGGSMNLGEISTRLGLGGIPAAAEVIMIERDVRLAELTGGRLHIANVSTLEGVKAIHRARRRGVPVTCDTAPPYFALNEQAVGDYRTFAKLSPPLRNERDRQAIVDALADGTIDVIASDHIPQDEDTKRVPFAQAAVGGIGLDTLLPITLELYHNGHLSLLGALGLVTHRAADLMNLPAGRIEAGAAADLVVFDPNLAWKIDASSIRSKSKNSPFDERPVQGRALRTVVDGRTVHLHGGTL